MITPQELFASFHPRRILDAATGSGGFIQFLLPGLADYDEITGIDTSERAAASFAQAFADQPKIRFLPMDGAQMSFADSTFDLVCIANSLHHLPDPRAVLSEMLRVLRPGGRLLVMEMIRDGQSETQLTHVLLHHWWAAVDQTLGITHNPTFTRAQLAELLDELELQEVQMHEINETEPDPLDGETRAELEAVIERYIQRAEGHPELQAQGEMLRQRVQTVGFHGATEVLFFGRKPSAP